MNVGEAIRNRRSIRKYKGNTDMPEEHIKAILEAAMMAPSALNTRPWEFVVLKSKEAKERALKIHPYAKHLKDSELGIIVCAAPEKEQGIAEGYFPQVCGAAIENILLQSLELGYGSCWCGIYPNDDRVKLFKEEFNLTSVPVALVVVGTPDEAPQAKGFYDDKKVTIL